MEYMHSRVISNFISYVQFLLHLRQSELKITRMQPVLMQVEKYRTVFLSLTKGLPTHM